MPAAYTGGMGNRIGAWVIALAVGLVYGAAGSVAHASVLQGFPVGVALAVIGGTALVLAMRLLTGDRWSALAGGLGMMVVTFVLAQPSAGGSVLFTTQHEIAALVWMGAIPLATAIVVAWPDLRKLGVGTPEPR